MDMHRVDEALADEAITALEEIISLLIHSQRDGRTFVILKNSICRVTTHTLPGRMSVL